MCLLILFIGLQTVLVHTLRCLSSKLVLPHQEVVLQTHLMLASQC